MTVNRIPVLHHRGSLDHLSLLDNRSTRSALISVLKARGQPSTFRGTWNNSLSRSILESIMLSPLKLAHSLSEDYSCFDITAMCVFCGVAALLMCHLIVSRMFCCFFFFEKCISLMRACCMCCFLVVRVLGCGRSVPALI